MNYLEIYKKYCPSLRKVGKNWIGLCPFHNDTNPSFSVNVTEGLFHCFGCEVKGNVYQFLKMIKGDEKDIKNKNNGNRTNPKIPNQPQTEQTEDSLSKLYAEKTYYHYFDFYGNYLYKKIRFEKPLKEGIKSKTFLIVPSGQKSHFYNEYALKDLKDGDNTEIWFAEGEKCVDTVSEVILDTDIDAVVLGFNSFGKEFEILPDEAKKLFRGRKIVLFQDNDETGVKKVQEAVEILKPFVKQIDLISFKNKKEHYDIADFLSEGGTILDALTLKETAYIDKTLLIRTGVNDIPVRDKWLIEPFIPCRAIILLDGLGGIGKSIFAMELCYALSSGNSFLLQQIRPQKEVKVLYLTAEETEDQFNDRLRKIENAYGGRNSNFHWVSMMEETLDLDPMLFIKDGFKVIKSETTDFLERAIEKIRPGLVVLDSLVNFFGLDENSASEAIMFYSYLKKLVRKNDCSFLLIHHQTKEAMRGNANLFRGSMVFREQARTRISFMKDKSGEKKVAVEKSNYFSELLGLFPISIKLQDGVWCVKSINSISENNNEDISEKTKNKKKKFSQAPEEAKK